MDIFLNASLQEIALEGEGGCTVNEYWSLIQNRLLEDPAILIHFGIDERAKSFYWSLVARLSDIILSFRVRGKKKRPLIPSDTTPSSSINSTDHVDPSKFTKASWAAMPWTQISETYGDSLRMIVSAERRQEVLIGECRKEPVDLTPPVWEIFALISRTRSKGMTQMELARKLNMDPRSAFHYIKTLLSKNLIVKMPIVFAGSNTNSCISVLFCKQNKAYMDYMRSCGTALPEVVGCVVDETNSMNQADNSAAGVLGEHEEISQDDQFHAENIKVKTTTLLAAALNQTLMAEDLMLALKIDMTSRSKSRKRYNRLLDSLFKQGFIEKVLVPMAEGRKARCFRLVKPYDPNQQQIDEHLEEKDANQDAEEALLEGFGVLSDLPLEVQIYRLIHMSENTGITLSGLRSRLSNLNVKYLHKLLGRMCSSSKKKDSLGIFKVAEFSGRERRYRYFSSLFFSQSDVAVDSDVDHIEPEIDVDFPHLDHNDSFSELPNMNISRDLIFDNTIQDGASIDNDDSLVNGAGLIDGQRQEENSGDLPTPAASPETLVRSKRGRPRKSLVEVDTEEPHTISVIPQGEIRQNLPTPISTPVAPRKRGRPRKSESGVQPLRPKSFRKSVTSVQCMDISSVSEIVNIAHLDDIACKVCKGKEDDVNMLICENCEKIGLHLYCATPPLMSVPEDEHFCSTECEEQYKAKKDATVVVKAEKNFFEEKATEEARLIYDGESEVSDWEGDNHDHLSDDDGDIVPQDIAPLPQSRPRLPKAPSSSRRGRSSSIIQVENVKAKAAARYGSGLSSYEGPRKRHLLTLIDKYTVFEVSNAIMREYSDLFCGANGQPSTTTVDKKTLIRVVKGLEGEDKARLYTVKIPSLTGGTFTRTLVMAPSITLDSDLFKSYVANLRESLLRPRNRYVQPEVRVNANVQIERLADMKSRLNVKDGKGKVKSTPRGSSTLTKPGVEGQQTDSCRNDTNGSVDINLVPSNILESPNETSADDPTVLRGAAEYGYVNAKMMRARAFHKWLFEFCNVNATPEGKPCAVNIVTLYTELSIHMYLKIVRFFVRSVNLDSYVSVDSYNPNTKLGHLPEDLRREIFLRKFKLTKSIEQLFDILCALGLLLKTTKNETASFGDFGTSDMSYYTLSDSVALRNYVKAGCKLVKRMDIRTLAGIEEFWSALEVISLSSFQGSANSALYKLAQANILPGDLVGNNSDIVHSSEPIPVNGVDEPEIPLPQELVNIGLTANWKVSYTFSAETQQILEPYVDRASHTTPLFNERKCIEIAVESEMSVSQVKFYFTKVQESFAREYNARMRAEKKLAEKHLSKRATAKLKLSAAKVSEGDRAAGFQESAAIVKALMGKRSGRKSFTANIFSLSSASAPALFSASADGSALLESFDSLEGPKIQSLDGLVSKKTHTRKNRRLWDNSEVETLAYGYSILLALTGGDPEQVTWQVIVDLLNDRKITFCRKKLHFIQRMPNYHKLLATLAEKCADLIAEGVDARVFPKPEHVDSNSLKVLIDYVKDRCPLEKFSSIRNESSFALPESMTDLLQKFSVKSILEGGYCDDLVDELTSTGNSYLAIMDVLYSRAFITHRSKSNSIVDASTSTLISNFNQASVDLAKATLLVILSTPDTKYDAHASIGLLTQFTDDVLEMAIVDLREKQTICKTKEIHERRIPGRVYMLSDKFMLAISGVLPLNIFGQAASYYGHLMKALEKTEVSPYHVSEICNSGTVACLLDQLSQNRIAILPLTDHLRGTIFTRHDQREVDLKLVIQKHAAALAANYVVTNSTRKHPRESTRLDSTPEAKRLRLMTSETVESGDSEIQSFCTIASEEDVAMSSGLNQIRDFSLAQELSIGMAEIENTFQVVHRYGQECASVDQISNVTSYDPRTIKDALKILIEMNPALVHATTSNLYVSSLIAKETMVRAKDGRYFSPRLWMDIDGHKTESIFRACVEMTLGHILKAPGIGMDTLVSRFDLVLGATELKEVLGYLLKKGAIRVDKHVNPARKSLGSALDSLFDNDGCTEEEEAFYYANLGWYLRFGSASVVKV